MSKLKSGHGRDKYWQDVLPDKPAEFIPAGFSRRNFTALHFYSRRVI
jgi:hypothetical protein